MAVSLKKKVQNYTIDQGATFEKTIGAENSSSSSVTISSGTVAGGIIKNFAYANTLQTFTTSVSGSNCTFSLTATQTAAVSPGKYVYDVQYTHGNNVTVERLAEGIITISAEATK